MEIKYVTCCLCINDLIELLPLVYDPDGFYSQSQRLDICKNSLKKHKNVMIFSNDTSCFISRTCIMCEDYKICNIEYTIRIREEKLKRIL